MLTVLIDDVRQFTDGRDCIRCLNSAEAVTVLQALHDAGTFIDDLWLDHDLGPDDDVRPVLELLLNWHDAGTPLAVGTVHVHTASVEGAHLITQICRRIGYDVEREYGLVGRFSW